VIFAMGGYAGGVSLFAVDGTLYYEYSALLLKRDKIEVGRLPAGEVSIAMEMRTPLERAAPAELKFWINGEAGHRRHGPAHRARRVHGLGDLRRGHGHELAGGGRLLREGAVRIRGHGSRGCTSRTWRRGRPFRWCRQAVAS
jgi:hypothetical protein